jgi:hypothetical protein
MKRKPWRSSSVDVLPLAQVEGAARQPVDARHRHHVAGAEAVEHPEKLAAVGPRSRHLSR